MDDEPTNATAFSYRAQTVGGQPVSGTVDADDAEAAQKQLQQLGLRVLEIAAAAAAPRPKPLRGADFIVFNQQMAQLTKAGLPIEHGLRLIARDLRGRRLGQTIRQVADELERGRPLAEAFDVHRGRFPSFYGQLLEVGVKTGNLAGVLFNLGRHLEMVQRLRAMLWQAVTYPIVVLLFVLVMLGFISHYVIPHFAQIFSSFDSKMPAATILVMNTARFAPYVVGAVLLIVATFPLWWLILRGLDLDRHVIDRCVLPLPLVGRVLSRNLIARWCDTLQLGVSAGLDLPASIELAGDAIGSPLIAEDGRRLSRCLQRGQPLSEAGIPRVIPATVVAAIELGGDQQSLASTLQTLSNLYQQQAEVRLSAAQVMIGPIFLAFIGVVIGFTVVALFLPMVSLVQTMM